MTDELKGRLCDEICKYKEASEKYSRAARNCATGRALDELLDYSQHKLEQHCENCVFMRYRMSEEKLEATIILKNLNKHNFDIADYRMSKSEAETVCKVLKLYIKELEFQEEMDRKEG